jgi:hypothetical protein
MLHDDGKPSHLLIIGNTAYSRPVLPRHPGSRQPRRTVRAPGRAGQAGQAKNAAAPRSTKSRGAAGSKVGGDRLSRR